MAKLSYKGTGRRCKVVFTGYNRPTFPCPNDASRGSEYCLACKRTRHNQERMEAARIRVCGNVA